MRTLQPPRLVFDFPDPCGGPARRRVLEDPLDVLAATRLEEVRPVLRRVEAAVAAGRTAAGWLSYESAPAFEPRMRVRSGERLPLAWFGIFERAREGDAPTTAPDVRAPEAWTPDLPRDRYEAAVAAIREHIADGRTYQVNLTTRLRARFDGNAEALYERLRRAQGPGYHAYLELGGHAIVSVSPELFFRRDGRRITARPMKGTRPRGRWLGEDRALADALLASEKERAENLMIVDLLRNDLSRIAEAGSVRVPHLLEVEAYRTVLQMTSTIEARLRSGCGLEDVLGALFPCGSVTGAPKISTMGVIADLEASPREVYCGAIGLLEPGERWTFSVPIRTLWLDRQRGRAEYGVGSGVTWDSTAAAEHEELLAKAAVLREEWPPFELLETLRLEEGRPVRLERHLRRMRESAEYFSMAFPEEDIRRALAAAAAAFPSGVRRLRLLLPAGGPPHVESEELDVADEGRRGVALAAAPVSSADRFLQHKTTRRAVYEERAAAFQGLFDVILWNERGELTELTRANLVVELDGRRLTPPRESGLLPGCLRAELLEAGAVQEAVLRPADLERASRIWSVSSLRGYLRVNLADGAAPPGEAERRRSSRRASPTPG